MIDADSFDAQLIADMIEVGYSYQKCTIALNMKKNQMNLPFVTFSAVYGVANRLDPVRRTVKKRKQGSFNPDDKWSKARKGWTKQLLVRLGKLHLNSEDGEEIKACYDITKMPTINLPQVVFWDETHAKNSNWVHGRLHDKFQTKQGWSVRQGRRICKRQGDFKY